MEAHKTLLRELEKKNALHPGTGKVPGTFGPPLGLTPNTPAQTKKGPLNSNIFITSTI